MKIFGFKITCFGRVFIASGTSLQKYSNGNGKKNKTDEDENELDEKIKPMERPVGSLHGTDILSEKQRAQEKEYFYREV